MLGLKKIIIGDGERGFVYRNRRLESVLRPGVSYRFVGFDRLEVSIHPVAVLEYTNKDMPAVIEALGSRLDEVFVLADIGVAEVGLLYVDGKLEDVLPPGVRKLYWQTSRALRLERLPLGADLEVPEAVAKRLRQLGALGRYALTADVPAESAGLLFIDGRFVRQLVPGTYAFWNFQKNVNVDVIEQRLQSVEVAGQELLTRDKVSLRVNLAASFRVVDPVAARLRVVKVGEFLYRELQYGLRMAVASRTLDELLADKTALDTEIDAHVRTKVGGYGIAMVSVGVKDVILPGEMKTILNAVVQAEKAAQANLIRRREESNATRSLLNTAKLIDESPTLLRLKELEALEKVTEKIDKLTVFGGLDGVLKQLVTLRPSA